MKIQTTGKTWLPIHDEQLPQLLKEGMDDSRIAAALGFTDGTVTRHRERLGLPRQNRTVARLAAKWESDRPLPRSRPSPLGVAHVWLGGRLVERPSGYFLDGRPVNLEAIMRETNRLIKATGAEQITPNPLWRV